MNLNIALRRIFHPNPLFERSNAMRNPFTLVQAALVACFALLVFFGFTPNAHANGPNDPATYASTPCSQCGQLPGAKARTACNKGCKAAVTSGGGTTGGGTTGGGGGGKYTKCERTGKRILKSVLAANPGVCEPCGDNEVVGAISNGIANCDCKEGLERWPANGGECVPVCEEGKERQEDGNCYDACVPPQVFVMETKSCSDPVCDNPCAWLPFDNKEDWAKDQLAKEEAAKAEAEARQKDRDSAKKHRQNAGEFYGNASLLLLLILLTLIGILVCFIIHLRRTADGDGDGGDSPLSPEEARKKRIAHLKARMAKSKDPDEIAKLAGQLKELEEAPTEPEPEELDSSALTTDRPEPPTKDKPKVPDEAP